MARRWTPRRFVILRRIRVAICVVAIVISSAVTFGFSARKTVALTVNGQTKTVKTYAGSVPRLLQEQGISIKSHDVVTSTNGTENLTDHSVVTVRSAYQATITINGQQVPFWTVASSAHELLGFFKSNEQAAASKITVNIDNVYNQLTGGMVINKEGPVTVIADGKTSIAPNGKLPAASILDSKGIILNKEDRVSVEEDGGTTILRVQRVTHGQETRTVPIPFGTQTIIDSTLQPGETVIRQQGENGEKQQVYDVTYVDGVAESETLQSETTTKVALDQIIAIGPDKTAENNDDTGNGRADEGANVPEDSSSEPSQSPSQSSGDSDSGPSDNSSSNSGSSDSGSSNNNSGSSGNSGNSGSDNPGNSSNPGSSDSGQSSGRLWHPTPAQAQTYAAGAAAQYGWTGQNWTDLVSLWNRESSWLWYAENSSSGAYGIPQSLPGSKMAAFGENWRDDAAVQIDWGLSYIAGRYGNPSAAWQHSEQYGWY